MLTQAQVMEAVTGGRKSECLDGRDYHFSRGVPAVDGDGYVQLFDGARESWCLR